MADELCSKCQRPPVLGCDGRGYMRVDDLTVTACPNIYRRQLAQHLGPEIANAPFIKKTPLLKLRREGGPPLVDLTTKNIVIDGCTWPGLLSHLKYVLAYKGPNYRFAIITDERIKNVFVGSEAYKARSLRSREEVATYNSLPDLVGADFDLIIIRLGYLGYKNQAASGALKEALLHRAALNRTTWLIQDPSHPWTHSNDPDVAFYVQENFRTVRVTVAATSYAPKPENVHMPAMDDVPEEEPPSDLSAYVVDDVPGEPSVEPADSAEVEETAAEEDPAPEEEESTPELFDDIPLLGSDQPDKKKNGWKKGSW